MPATHPVPCGSACRFSEARDLMTSALSFLSGMEMLKKMIIVSN